MQREGLELIPDQLKPKHLSKAVRARLWGAVYRDMQKATQSNYNGVWFAARWQTIIEDFQIEVHQKMAHDLNTSPPTWEKGLGAMFESGTYGPVLNFCEFLLRHRNCSSELRNGIISALEECKAAYRVLDGDTIVAITADENGEALKGALAATAGGPFQGARTHLKQAASALRSGDYADSVRESIHSVEAVLTVIDPKADSFEKALAKLESATIIHKALKAAFTKLYGFTSDERGVRHSLQDLAESKVDEFDAIYMLGSCSAFVAYLIGKARNASLIRG